MSIEKDWKWLFDYEFFDSPGCLGKQLRCMFDLRDRLAAVEKRLDSIQSDVDVALDAVIEKEQQDPSSIVMGDLFYFDGHGVDVLVAYDNSDHPFGRAEYGGKSRIWHKSGHPATDEERIKYKGEPPTVNGELCCVREMDNHPWETMPRRFVGLTDDGRFVTQCMWGVSIDLFAWEKARKLTPKELKQHQAGEESK